MTRLQKFFRITLAIFVIFSLSLTSAQSKDKKSSTAKKKIENSKKSTKKKAAKKTKKQQVKNNDEVAKESPTTTNQGGAALISQPTNNFRDLKTAVFASGCFFGVEELARREAGVVKAEAGYAGGTVPNPSYDAVKSGMTGHAMAVRITYDANQTSFEELARLTLKTHDPLAASKRPEDSSSPFRSEIFYTDGTQKEVAENLIKTAKKSGYFNGKITINSSKLNDFYKAENYYQLYSKNAQKEKICQINNKNLKF